MPVTNMNQISTTRTGKLTGVSGRSPFETSKYQVDGKVFMVEPVFQESGSETIGTILVKLMQADLGST